VRAFYLIQAVGGGKKSVMMKWMSLTVSATIASARTEANERCHYTALLGEWPEKNYSRNMIFETRLGRNIGGWPAFASS